jgi:tRNA(Ile)-lysidine synthase
MALLRLAAQAAACRLTVLTVDHGLRPGSAAEARQVGQWCRGLGLAHQTLNWAGASPGSGVQARARKARYDLMGDWCNANAASALLTAHTRDDQAETVLMRLLRTDSFDSLAGIPQFGQWHGLPLIRPLLSCRRGDLRAYLAALGQDWIEDPSNDDARFERVRLRRLMPALEETGLTVERLVALAESCRDVGDAIGAAAGRWCRAHLEQEPGLCRFPAADFGRLPLALRVRILGDVIAHFGGGGTPERAELERLAEAMAAGTLSRRTLGGALAWRRQASILIGREPARIDPRPVAVPAAGQLVWDRRYLVTAPPGSAVLPAAVSGVPRPSRDVPAVVFGAQPVVKLPDGSMVLAPSRPDGGVTARFVAYLAA